MGMERRRSRRVRPNDSEPIEVAVRLSEGADPLAGKVWDISVHGFGLLLPRTFQDAVRAAEEFDLEFVLPGQLDRIGLRAILRQMRPSSGILHLGLEFQWEDAVQQDWATSHIASYIAQRCVAEPRAKRAA